MSYIVNSVPVLPPCLQRTRCVVDIHLHYVDVTACKNYDIFTGYHCD